MKYKDYFNFELGNRDIYSHNDILGMTVQDLFDNELPLGYQYNTIGIPKDDELIASPNTHQYTTANGKLRWRSSSKTLEELLEEERQRRLALQGQQHMVQNQLGAMNKPAAPIQNAPEPEDIPMTEDMSEPNSLQNSLSNLVASFVDRINQGESFLPWDKKRKQTSSEPDDNSLVPDLQPIDKDQSSEVETVNTAQNAPAEQAMNYLEENGPEDITGGAASLETNDYRKVIAGGIEKYYGLSDGYLDILKNTGKEFLEKGSDKNNNMSLGEEIQGLVYEKLARPFLPMSSKGVANAMHNLKLAKKDKNITVYDDLELLEDKDLKSKLKKVEDYSNKPVLEYSTKSKESKNFSNSPEIKNYVKKNYDKIIAGEMQPEVIEFMSNTNDKNLSDLANKLNPKAKDRAYFLQHATVLNPKIDEYGTFTCDLADAYDFKKRANTIQNISNNWSFAQQKKGNLDNYSTLFHINNEFKEYSKRNKRWRRKKHI